LNIQQVTQVFREQDWVIQPIDENAVRFTQLRRVSSRLVRRLAIAYGVGMVLGTAWFIERNILARLANDDTVRDLWQLLAWLLPVVLVISLTYGFLLAFFWREADDEHILIAKQDGGQFRVSRLGKREFISSLNEVRHLAQADEGFQRNTIVTRWLLTSVGAIIISGLVVIIASAIFVG
jgi:hypothetical protein